MAKNKSILGLIIAAGAFLFLRPNTARANAASAILPPIGPRETARGIRNNNPLNITFNPANKWVGQTGSDGKFVVFASLLFGVRAAYKLLMTYRNKYRLDTIEGILNRWAPPSENPTFNYVAYVSRETGIDPFEPLRLSDYPAVMDAMARFESGQGIPLDLIQNAIRRA